MQFFAWMPLFDLRRLFRRVMPRHQRHRGAFLRQNRCGPLRAVELQLQLRVGVVLGEFFLPKPRKRLKRRSPDNLDLSRDLLERPIGGSGDRQIQSTALRRPIAARGVWLALLRNEPPSANRQANQGRQPCNQPNSTAHRLYSFTLRPWRMAGRVKLDRPYFHKRCRAAPACSTLRSTSILRPHRFPTSCCVRRIHRSRPPICGWGMIFPHDGVNISPELTPITPSSTNISFT
jgi:hypothetical protein